MKELETKITSVYIHIPFCNHICNYCDFNKVYFKGQPVDDYIQMLFREIDLTIQSKVKLKTLYIGGGSPSALSVKQLETLLQGLNDRFNFEIDYEFTIEVNPGDMDVQKIMLLSEYGVNRVSIGVQSFNENLLKLIGRTHRQKDIDATINLLEQNNIKNISLDLMYALPTQTLNTFSETLNQALAYDLPHYSIYSLILEEKTIFYNLLKKNQIQLVENSVEADMYDLSIETMNQAGVYQYEISNFSKNNYQSKHNLVYWNNEEYYGFGAGASGYVNGSRYKNHGPIQHYLQPLHENHLPILYSDEVSLKEKIEEEMFLGLRKTQGVSTADFQKKFQTTIQNYYGDVLDDLKMKNLIDISENYIFLSEKGKHFGNDVFEAFLLSE